MINWEEIWLSVDDCESVKEIEELLVKNGVDKLDVFGYFVKSMRRYGKDLEYRRNRNKGLSELRKENEELKKKLNVK